MRRRNIKTNEKENINIDEKQKINKKEKKKINIDKRKLLSLIVSVITIIVSIAVVVTMLIVDMLPFKYVLALIVGLVAINGILCFLLLWKRKNKIVKTVVNVIQALISIVGILASIYVFKTYKLIDSMNNDVNTKKENYAVIVLKDSSYKKLKDLDGKVIEYYSNDIDNSELAIEKLKEEVNISAVSNEDVFVVGKTLLDSEVDAILLEESQKLLLDEELEGFMEKTEVIHTVAVDISVETIAKEAAVSSEPFIVYISGIDTYGEIASVSRSDVNMVAVINPKTYQVLLVNIPRDYYVQLHGTSGKRDKLTHAGMYGVERSVTTIEDLLKIDINYYFKVNFTSLIDIVNAIGGIEVYSEYNFTEYMGQYSYVKGMNKLNGEQALAFARERKAFSNGDRMRGKNQQAVLSAVVEQASKPSIITKFDSLLKSLSSKFQTNMSTDKMMELVKLQVSKMPTWTISTVSLTGGDARAYAYSSGSTPLYVMLPSQNSINDAMSKIQTVISGGMLEGAYDSVSGNIIGLRTIEIPVVEEPEEIIPVGPNEEEETDKKDEELDNEDTNKDDEKLDNEDDKNPGNDSNTDVDNDKNEGTNTDKENEKDDNSITTTPPNSNENTGNNGGASGGASSENNSSGSGSGANTSNGSSTENNNQGTGDTNTSAEGSN